MFENIKEKNIENVMVFVSDSLRYDFLPHRIREMGIVCKTIAAGLYTASTFPTIFSGLYPYRHGVFLFSNLLKKNMVSLLNLNGMNTSLWCETTWPHMPPDQSAIHKAARKPPGIHLKEIDPPFIYIEDDKGGHSPYGEDFDVEKGGKGGGIADFYRKYGTKGIPFMKSRYRKSINDSVKMFMDRMNILKQRGLLRNTLVIFTADHGELLGEYGGLIGHGRPPCPELVYVPTVFIHSSFPPTEIGNGVLRQIDFLPTISGLLDKKIEYEMDGKNLLEEERLPNWGLNFGEELFHPEGKISRHFAYRSRSVWDRDGGYVFHKYGLLRGIPAFLWRIYRDRSSEFTYFRENLGTVGLSGKLEKHARALFHLTNKELKYGSPVLQKKDAKRIMENYIGSHKPMEAPREEFDEITKKRLKALGYMD